MPGKVTDFRWKTNLNIKVLMNYNVTDCFQKDVNSNVYWYDFHFQLQKRKMEPVYYISDRYS